MKIYYKRLKNFGNDEFDRYYSMADESRRNAINRLKIENDKRRSVLGEALARYGISKLLDCSEEEITFSRTEKGKPLCNKEGVFFNVSHCKDIVICAVDDENLGIDIERIRNFELETTYIACTDSDRKLIFGECEPNPNSFALTDEILKSFFTVWTAKEAYFKFLGIGIIGLQDVSYNDIKEYCKTFYEKDYVFSIYSEKKSNTLEFKEVL